MDKNNYPWWWQKKLKPKNISPPLYKNEKTIMNEKFKLNKKQIDILNELMVADRRNNGICYQNQDGSYNEEIKTDIDFLKSFGFITEYTSETHINKSNTIIKKGWTITYHGIAFLFAYNTLTMEMA